MVNEFQESGAKDAPRETPLVIDELWRVKPEAATASTNSPNSIQLKRQEIASLDSLMRTNGKPDVQTLLSQQTWDEMKPRDLPVAPGPLDEIYKNGVIKLHEQGTALFGLGVGKFAPQILPNDTGFGVTPQNNRDSNANSRLGSLRGLPLTLQYQLKF